MASIGPDNMADIVELRRRLEEAEATLRAIRDGEVDALVVKGGDSDRVFSLGDGDASYRAFMEAMDLGAAALDADRSLLYANAALCDVFGLSAATLLSRGLLDALDPGSAAQIGSLIDKASSCRQSAQLTVLCGDDRRHLIVSVSPLPLAFSQGYAITFTDITERVLAQAAEQSERVGRAIMASANEPVIVCDANGVVTHATGAIAELSAGPAVGRRFSEAFPLHFQIDSGIIDAEDMVTVALGGQSMRGIEARLDRGDSGTRALFVSAAPLRLDGGSISGCVMTMVDMTERKAIEERHHFLMGELNHRVKNTLTMVSAISSRTLASSISLSDFKERFPRRIEALAATHDLLVKAEWGNLSLQELIVAETAPYLPARSDRVTYPELDIRLPSRVAIPLGLVIHELVTNAVKHGALSNAQGVIAIGAQRHPEFLEISWIESGGPTVSQPERSGFGQTLIARSLGNGPNAGAVVEFRPDGVICRMRIASGDLR